MLQGVNSDVLGWFHHLCFVLERINCCNSVVSSRFHNPCFARGRIKCSIITDKCQVFHKSPFHATKHKSPVNKTFGFVENSHRVSGLLLCRSNAPVRISNMSIINTQHGRVTPIYTRYLHGFSFVDFIAATATREYGLLLDRVSVLTLPGLPATQRKSNTETTL